MSRPLFPLRKGFNVCLNWYQPDESLRGYKKASKRTRHHTVQKPIREESHMPSRVQENLSFDMF